MPKAGFAKVDLTPKSGIRLFGKAPPAGEDLRISDRIHARAAVFQARQQVALVSLDLIWVSRGFVDRLKAQVHQRFGIPEESVLVVATHTHGTPQIRELTFDGYEEDGDYAAFALNRTMDALSGALSNMMDVCFISRQNRFRGSVCRRKKILDRQALRRGRVRMVVANRPDFTKAVDDVCTVLWVYPASGGDHPIGAVLNLACHSNVTSGKAVTADFPGALEAELRKRHDPSFHLIFLQGYCGDVRPAVVAAPKLTSVGFARWVYHRLFDPLLFIRTNGPDVVRDFARSIADDLDREFEERRVELNPRGRVLEIELPQEKPARAVLNALYENGNPGEKAYARYVLEAPEVPRCVKVRVQGLALCDSLCIAAIEGEVFSSYARWLRRVFEPATWMMPVGCAGGMVGYLPDERALSEGGYETDRSLPLFGLAGRFQPSIESRLKEGLAEVVSSCSSGGLS